MKRFKITIVMQQRMAVENATTARLLERPLTFKASSTNLSFITIFVLIYIHIFKLNIQIFYHDEW